MRDNQGIAQMVSGALWDLREALHVSQMHANGGLRGDPVEIEAVWEQLNSSLRASIPAIQQPKRGHGLEVLWLTTVYKAVQSINERLHLRSGSEILSHAGDTVFHLVTTECERGYELAKHYGSQRKTLPDLEIAATSALDELRKLSADWEETRRRRLNEAKEQGTPVPFSWYSHTTPARRAGELLLSAVDALEIPLSALDEEFRESLLGNVETPNGIVWGRMTGGANESLGDLLSRVTPPPAADPNDSTQPYSTPQSYQRDMWIYENMPHHTCRTLSDPVGGDESSRQGPRVEVYLVT